MFYRTGSAALVVSICDSPVGPGQWVGGWVGFLYFNNNSPANWTTQNISHEEKTPAFKEGRHIEKSRLAQVSHLLLTLGSVGVCFLPVPSMGKQTSVPNPALPRTR